MGIAEWIAASLFMGFLVFLCVAGYILQRDRYRRRKGDDE